MTHPSLEFGAKTTSIYIDRPLKVYPLYEAELDSLSHFNDLCTFFASIASFFISPIIDSYLEAQVSHEFWRKSFVHVALFALFFVLTIVFFWKKKSTIKHIKENSTPITDE
jgi:hypothetical protein